MSDTSIDLQALDHDDVVEQAADWRQAGKNVAIATVVTTWGSSPRPVGSQLAIDEDGNMAGSVSGGCIEGAVVHEAREVMADGKPRLLDFTQSLLNILSMRHRNNCRRIYYLHLFN